MTTLNQIRSHSPCAEEYAKLLKHLNKTKPDDEPISLLTILEVLGLQSAIWVLRTEPNPERIQQFVLALARRVEHAQAKATLDVVEHYLNGTATKAELKKARKEAHASVSSAAAAARAATYAERKEARAAAAAAAAAARAAAAAADAAATAATAPTAANAAANAAATATYAASAASADIAEKYVAEQEAQAKIFREIFA